MNTVAYKRRKNLEAEGKGLVKRRKKLEARESCLNDLPENCIYNIFVRLPLESLCNLRFVCKSWRGIVKSTNFPGSRGIIFSTRVQNFSPPHKKVFSPESNSTITNRVSSFHIKFMEFNKDDGKTSSRIKEYNTAFKSRIVATCDGLVVLEKDLRTPGLILLNPVTRELQHIPMGTISSERLYGLAAAFCHVSSRKYYKLLCLFMKDKALGCEIMDLAGSGGSWRAVDVPPTKRFHLMHSPVFAMGALHWIQYVDDDHVVDCMVSMRLDDDKYETTTIPSARTGGDQIQFNTVFAMGEFLGFSSRSGKSNQIQVWILRGVECGWEKQYNIDASGLGSMIPLLYYEGDDQLVFKSGGGTYFYAYNRHSQRLTKIQTICACAPTDYCTIFPHVNTHVSLRR